LAAYAPYFWNAYLDGSDDEEQWNDGDQVIVFNVTEDDRYEYPEFPGRPRCSCGKTREAACIRDRTGARHDEIAESLAIGCAYQ
jgi:hypothetical protein